ncbi:MAG: hypothetical protein KDB90_09395 [Planctomycetes bacterium]|nr:hypothetical protein [Planctomycetota bacterium]
MLRNLVCLIVILGIGFALGCPSGVAVAQDSEVGETKDVDAVVTAWDAYQKGKEAYQATRKQLVADHKAGKISTDDANDKLKEAQEVFLPLQDAFLGSMEKADWKAYAGDAHREMLDLGLYLLGLKHTKDGAYASSAKAYEAQLEMCPDSEHSLEIRYQRLPQALVAAGELENALIRAGELVESAGDDEKPLLMVALGDLRAASGDVGAAVMTYKGVLELTGEETLQRNDPRRGAQGLASNRLLYVGRPARDFAGATWVGAEAKSISDLKGSIVVFHHCEIASLSSRQAMRRHDDIYKHNKDRQLVVVGLTCDRGRGFKPSDRDDLSKGEVIRDIAQEAYAEHISEFRELADISYPFVLAPVLQILAHDFQKSPGWAVVNREGVVVLKTQGEGNQCMMEACVDALLAKDNAEGDEKDK